MKLTQTERLILWNQYEIRKLLDVKRASHCEKVQEALSAGYQPLYEYVLDDMDKEVSTDEKAKFVYDVLDMFDAFQRYERSSGVAIDDHHATFRGFDGHGGLVGFARFNVEKLGRWDYLNIKEFDAHMPIEQMYERMLTVWFEKPLPNRFALNKEDVNEILAAAVHPSNR